MWDLAHAVWQFTPVCDDADPWLGDWPSTPDRSARIAALVGGYQLSADRADELADMVVEVIAGCRRSVVRKIAAEIPAFVQMGREGILEALESQRRAALRSDLDHDVIPVPLDERGHLGLVQALGAREEYCRDC